MALAREQRIANMLTRAGVGAASVQAATRTAVAPATRAPAKLVGNTLRTQLVERFKLTCTKCFTAAIQQLNATPIAEVRARPGDFAKSVYENAKEGRGTAALLEWADFKTHGFARYEQLILDACDACEPHLPPGVIVVQSDRHGYGDAILTSWIAEGAKREGKQIVHYATGSMAELAVLFGQSVVGEPVDGMVNLTTPHVEELRLRGKVSAIENRAHHIGIRHTARPVAKISDGIKEWAREVMGASGVLLFPESTRTIRTWPVSYFVDLETLLRQAGYNPRACLWKEAANRTYFADPFTDIGWERMLGLIHAAKFVVGNNSGLVHVAGTMGVRAFVLAGLTTPESMTGIPEMIHVSVSPEEVPCVGCYYGAPIIRRSCDLGCKALYALMPERVAAEIHRINTAEDLLEALYRKKAAAPDDNEINEHCGTLREYASRSRRIVELGCHTTQTSTVALLSGRPVFMRSFDINPSLSFNWPEVISRTDYQLIHGDSRAITIPRCDLLFIDAEHTYEAVKIELKRHSPQVNRWIILHDTEDDVAYRTAVDEFVSQGQFAMVARFTNQHGLTILERREYRP